MSGFEVARFTHWVRVKRDNYWQTDIGVERLTVEHAAAIAAERGQVVVYPQIDELFIDLDSRKLRDEFERRVALVQASGIALVVGKITESHSSTRWRKRYHARVRFPRTLSAVERIAWQAVLGSDAIREMLDLVRTMLGHEHSTLFFETPEPPVERAITL